MAFGPIPACFILFIAANCLPLLGNAPSRRPMAHWSSSNIGEGSAFTEGVLGASVSGLVPPGKPATEGTRGFFISVFSFLFLFLFLFLLSVALCLPSDCPVACPPYWYLSQFSIVTIEYLLVLSTAHSPVRFRRLTHRRIVL